MKSFKRAKFNPAFVLLFLVTLLFARVGYADNEPRIESVTHESSTVMMQGNTIKVVLRGEPKGKATFDIAGVVSHVPMKETLPGVYQGSYTFVQPGSMPFASVTGHLRSRGGESTMVDAKPVSIALHAKRSSNTVALPLTVTDPAPGAVVSQVFVVSGTTRPNATVIAQVWTPNGLGMWNRGKKAEARATNRGIFQIQVDSGYASGGADITVMVQTKTDQGMQSEENRIDLTRR